MPRIWTEKINDMFVTKGKSNAIIHGQIRTLDIFYFSSPISLPPFPISVNVPTIHPDDSTSHSSPPCRFTTTSDLCWSCQHAVKVCSVLFSPFLHPGLNLFISCFYQPPTPASFLPPWPPYCPLYREQNIPCQA